MQEIWKDIEGFNGKYQISNMGNLRSFSSVKKGELIKPATDKRGYRIVVLSRGKGDKTYATRIHRLVAKYFIPNPLNLPQVNHKNEIKDDNRVENLEWCNAKYNNNYGTHGQRATEHKCKRIYCVELDKYFNSASEAQKILGVSAKTIRRICRGETKNTRGYHWENANEVSF